MIRDIDESDLSYISEYVHELDFNCDIASEYINNPYFGCLIYEINGNIVGFLKYSIIYERVEIDYLFVVSNHRNKGIANKLLNKLFNICFDNKIQNITLEVRLDNIEAINLYKKNGFSEIKVIKNYYGTSDGLLLFKELM